MTMTSVLLLLNLIISIAAVLISSRQWWLSREKLRLDLYNRRFDIYTRVLDFYQDLLQWDSSQEQLACQKYFIKAVRESRFIFPTKSGVHTFLQEFEVNSLKITNFDETWNASSKKTNDALPSLEQICAEKKGLKDPPFRWLENAQAKLEEKIAPYVRFEKL